MGTTVKNTFLQLPKRRRRRRREKKKALEPAHWNLGYPEESVASDKCVLQNSVQKRQLNMEE